MSIELISNPGRATRGVLAFTGRPDAGRLSRALFEELTHLTEYQPVARWDLDGYWTVEGVRPRVEVRHGQIQRLVWPQYEFFSYQANPEERVLLGRGPEPGTRWRDFTQVLLNQLTQWSCRKVILVGSRFDQIFHDEIRLSAVVQDVRGYNLARHWHCQALEYQGPTSIHAAIMEGAAERNISTISLWAHLPFYLKDAQELVIHRLLEIIADFTQQQWRLGHLLGRWREKLSHIEELLEQEPDLLEQVKKLQTDAGDRVADATRGENIIRIDEFLKRKGDPIADE
ncbi:MAG: hypothetical protein AUK55_12285 [Syntrophobacteraceae bacterium CG2_30_61_12]|nr:MAG: hypothetical protein AUK55_12285 [Syntrophobacteraceae bacterium CG2_30_61_12]